MNGKYQNEVTSLRPLRETMYENIFKVHADGEYNTYNILQQVTIPADLDPDIYMEITTMPGMPWSIVSYRIYKTMDLWWLICLVNGIDNPIKLPPAGTKLKAVKPEYVQQMLSIINSKLS